MRCSRVEEAKLVQQAISSKGKPSEGSRAPCSLHLLAPAKSRFSSSPSTNSNGQLLKYSRIPYNAFTPRMAHRAPLLPLSALLAHLASARPTPALIRGLPAVSALSQWFDAQGKLNLAHFEALGEDSLVPLELTSPTKSTFERLEVPLSYYFSYLASSLPASSTTSDTLYLAQFAPPPSLARSLPPPEPIANRLSHSSLWMGITPTTTPLHRDPEDNILYQLAGSKTVRLLPPNEGEVVLAVVRAARSGGGKGVAPGKMRGEEMMRPGAGGERDALEEAVWGKKIGAEVKTEAGKGLWEAKLEKGDALFVPRGWWHAVRGRTSVGEAAEGEEELNASVNWWFR